jgi:hypothetical protein
MSRDIEIRETGKVGDLRNGWEYAAVFPIESRNSGIVYGAKINSINDFLHIYSYENFEDPKFEDVKLITEIRLADKIAYDIVKNNLSTKLYCKYFKADSGVKIVDKTHHRLQLEIEFS